LTARERVTIASALVGLSVGIRVVAVIAAIREPWGDVLMFAAVSIPILVLLPWGLTIVERFHHCRSNGCRWRMSAWVAAYVCLCAVFAMAIHFSILLLAGDFSMRADLATFAQQMAMGSLVLLFVGDGVGGAIHRYRAALLERERCHEVDMAEATHARQAIEGRTRPDAVIAILETIAARALVDAAGARLLLLRLARHQRMLLTRSSPPSFEDELRTVRSSVALFRPDVRLEIGRCEAFPDLDVAEPWLRSLEKALMEAPPGRYLVECDRREDTAVLHVKAMGPGPAPLQASLRWFSEADLPAGFSESRGISVELPLTRPRPDERRPERSGEVPSSAGSWMFTAALVVNFLSDTLPHLGSVDLQRNWNLTVMMLLSAVLWLVAGPCVYGMTAVCVRLRLSAALLLSSASALAGAAAVTAASFGLLRLITVGDEFMPTLLPVMLSRNADVAFMVCTSSFAEGFSRMLIAARADVMRAQHETIRAEARELEARFHPHFLFNALASIAGLIRVSPGAAGEMCRLLARLVARTRAYAGIPSWTVKDEVTLVEDYLAIQRRRFAQRLRIADWVVDPSTMDAAIPRLSLQPLLENIFVHAVAASYGVVSMALTIRQRGRMLRVELWNDTAGGPSTPGHGRGLAFVSSRVRDAGGRVLVVPSPDRFTVHLTIPIRKPAAYAMSAPIPQRA
jgi:hypothetical protein